MLEILGEAPSVKGHKMVSVKCSYCGSVTEKRRTSLSAINSCGCNQNNYYDIVGREFTTRAGNTIKVIGVIKGTANVVVEFLGKDGFTEVYRLSHLKDGSYADPFEVSYYGVGYYGMKKKQKQKDVGKIRNIWVKMLQRCYDPSFDRFGSYGGKGVKVSEDWHNFANFYSWYISQPRSPDIKYNVDKDLLSLDTGVKIYSPDTCCLLPEEVNLTLIIIPKVRKKFKRIKVLSPAFDGVKQVVGFYDTVEEADEAYQKSKEQVIHKLAEKYKDAITEKVYTSLKNWSYQKASCGYFIEYWHELQTSPVEDEED